MLEKKDFITIFTDRAGEFPDKAAIVDLDGTRETAYRELDALSGRICTALKKGGVKKAMRSLSAWTGKWSISRRNWQF